MAARPMLWPGQPAARAPELSLVEILRVIMRYRTLLLGVMLLGIGLAVFALAVLPPRYEAEALVLIEPHDAQPGESILGRTGVTNDAAAIDSQVKIIASRSLVREVVTTLGLVHDRDFIATPDLLDRLQALVRPQAGTATPAPVVPLTESEAVDRFIDQLEVRRDGKTNVIAITFEAGTPELAARLANALADRYIVGQLARKYEATRRAADWLNEQLTQTSAAVEAAEARLAEYRQSVQGAYADALAMNGVDAVSLKRDLVAASAERAALAAKLQRLRNLTADPFSQPAFEDLGGSAALQNLFALKNQALRREAELAAQYGSRHPKIIDVRAELAEIDSSIRAEQRALVGRVAADLDQVKNKERTLEREIDRIKSQTVAQREAELRIADLTRDVETNRRLHQTYLERFEAIADQEDVQRPDAKVISEAVPPGRPVFPQPQMFVSLSATVSLVLALMLIYLLEQVDRGYRTANALELETGLSCLAMVPRIRREKGDDGERLAPQDYAVERPASRYAEAMRSILAELALTGPRPRALTVLLTSSQPGEGKSTTALSLARTAAAEGLRVLLVDADMRRPRLHELAGMSMGPGLVEVLRGEVPLQAALRVDAETGLTILPGSRRLAQPTRLLGPGGIGALIEQLRPDHDLILIDSAPLTAVADARVLAPLCDRMLFLVQWHMTRKALVRQCLASLGEMQEKVAGLVLNRVDLRRHARLGMGEASFGARRLDAYYME